MGSFVKFRDIAAVIVAGNGLATAGDTFAGKVAKAVDSIREKEAATLRGSDDYSHAFNDTYRKSFEDGARNELLLKGAGDLAEPAKDIGRSVVKAVTGMLYVDATNSAAIAKALRQHGKA
jgi:hypothetical protein